MEVKMLSYFPDRRGQRSELIYEALQYQLGASARRAKFSSLVLADDAGLVVSAIGNKAISEHMAAISPGLTKHMRSWHGKIATNRGKVRLSVTPVRFEDNLLYLSATEGLANAIPRELFWSGLGVLRILSN